MPPIEEQGLHQKAVLWAYASRDAHGSPQVSAGVELDVRWEFAKRSSQDAQGGTEPYDATVFVKQVIVAESIMCLGKLADLPATKSNLYRVASCEEIPDIKGRKTQRTVLLNRYGNTLPTIV